MILLLLVSGTMIGLTYLLHKLSFIERSMTNIVIGYFIAVSILMILITIFDNVRQN